MFSCEADYTKRSLIMKQNDEVARVFARVEDFGAEKGYCYVCGLAVQSLIVYIYIVNHSPSQKLQLVHIQK